MVFGDFMSKYPSDGDEKQVVREALKSSFQPVLKLSRMMQISRICACCSFLSMKCASFLVFVENVVFTEYMSEYSSDGDEK